MASPQIKYIDTIFGMIPGGPKTNFSEFLAHKHSISSDLIGSRRGRTVILANARRFSYPVSRYNDNPQLKPNSSAFTGLVTHVEIYSSLPWQSTVQLPYRFRIIVTYRLLLRVMDFFLVWSSYPSSRALPNPPIPFPAVSIFQDPHASYSLPRVNGVTPQFSSSILSLKRIY